MPDAAAGVAAESAAAESRRDRRSRPAAAAAGDAGIVPRVACDEVGAVLRRRAHSELVHVPLADDDRAGVFEQLHDRRVVRRVKVGEHLARTRRCAPGGTEVVLERDRHAGQRTGGAARIHVRRPPQGPLRIRRDEGVNFAVELLDACQRLPRQLLRRDVPRTNGIACGKDRVGEHVRKCEVGMLNAEVQS